MNRPTIRKRHLAVLFSTPLLAIALAGDASAKLSLSVDAGGVVGPGATVFVEDNGPGDLEAATGFIRFDNGGGSMGIFEIIAQTGLSKPIIGPGKIQLGNVSISSGAGTLTVALSDTGFAEPELNRVDLQVGGTTDGTVSVVGYADDTPTVPAGGPAFGTKYSSGSVVGMTGAFDGSSSSVLFDGGSPYSLTLVATITHTGPRQITTFSQITFGQIPEPGSIVLAAMGMMGLLGVRRRRRCAK